MVIQFCTFPIFIILDLSVYFTFSTFLNILHVLNILPLTLSFENKIENPVTIQSVANSVS